MESYELSADEAEARGLDSTLRDGGCRENDYDAHRSDCKCSGRFKPTEWEIITARSRAYADGSPS